MNPIGIIASFVYPFAFVDPDDEESDVRNEVFLLMASYVIICLVYFVLVLTSFFDRKTDDNDEVNFSFPFQIFFLQKIIFIQCN